MHTQLWILGTIFSASTTLFFLSSSYFYFSVCLIYFPNDFYDSDMIELDFDEFIWLLWCYFYCVRYWKLTFLLRDFDEAFEDSFANRFNRSESLDCRLFPEPMLFLSLMLMLQLKFGSIRVHVIWALSNQSE